MNNRAYLPRAMVHRHNAKGLTLIELGFVIIILAVIIAVALTLYNTLSGNKQVADTVTDVANIRNAVSRWAGGLPLQRTLGFSDSSGSTPVEETLDGWDDLAPMLPGQLGLKARSVTGLTLPNANAWTSTYALVVEDAGGYYNWNLTIDEIPQGLATELRSKLASGARFVPELTTGPPDTLKISFRVGA